MLGESIDDTPMSETRAFLNGVIKILPLCFAVLPWGLLAGSMAIQAGLTTLQAIAMSSIDHYHFRFPDHHTALFICIVFTRRYFQTTIKISVDARFLADR